MKLWAVFIALAVSLAVTVANNVQGKLATDSRVHCTFTKTTSVLSCIGPNGNVDCGAVANFTALGEAKHTLFALGKHPNDEKIFSKAPSQIHYHLLPRTVDNKHWLNYTVVHNKKRVKLFVSKSFRHFGFRVKEKNCFRNMIRQFNSIKNYEFVHVQGSSEKVPIFGDVKIN